MPKWKRRSDERPAELAQAALELCAERGVHATRVADVAARAGVTVGTVYRYFHDKDALIDAALQRTAVPSRTSAAPVRPGGSLPAIADAVRRWSTFFRDAGTQGVRVALSDPARDAGAPRAALGQAIAEFVTLVRDGASRGELRSDLSPEHIARILVGAAVLGPVLGERDAADAQFVEAVAAIATRGLRGDGPSWRATA